MFPLTDPMMMLGAGVALLAAGAVLMIGLATLFWALIRRQVRREIDRTLIRYVQVPVKRDPRGRYVR